MQFIENNQPTRIVYMYPRKKYGIFNFLVDVALTGLTGGLWLIWVFCREMRKR